MPSTVAEALAILREAIEQDYPGFAPIGVTIQSGQDDYLPIQLPLLPGPTGRAAPVAESRPLSPTEAAILRALAGKGWQTGQQIADACGQIRSTLFNAVLSNLAEAGVIESSTRNGYRLHVTS